MFRTRFVATDLRYRLRSQGYTGRSVDSAAYHVATQHGFAKGRGTPAYTMPAEARIEGVLLTMALQGRNPRPDEVSAVYENIKQADIAGWLDGLTSLEKVKDSDLFVDEVGHFGEVFVGESDETETLLSFRKAPGYGLPTGSIRCIDGDRLYDICAFQYLKN